MEASGMIGIITWILTKLSGGLLDKVLDAFSKSEDARVRAREIDSDTTKAALKAYVETVKSQNALQQAKLGFPWFWIMAGMFVIPLGLWWGAILIDSIFHLNLKVANLPTQELRDYAGQMIQFIFYSGGTAATIRAIIK
jgi:hypothetical protein